MSNKPYLLALNRIAQVGPSTILKFLKKWPQLQELFETPMSGLEAVGIPYQIAKAISHFE